MQLKQAFKIYLQKGDSISTHTLIHASHEILNVLTDNGSYVFDSAQNNYRVINRISLKLKFNETKNFFKHANRDKNCSINFDPEINVFLLIDCLQMLEKLNYCTTLVNVMSLWFSVEHPKLVKIKNIQGFKIENPSSKDRKFFIELLDNMCLFTKINQGVCEACMKC